MPFAIEVATYEPRDTEELARYHQVRRRLIDRLTEEGLTDVVEHVDFNLFGGSLDPRLSDADIADFTELLDLGQPMSVFIAPERVDPVWVDLYNRFDPQLRRIGCGNRSCG